MDNIFLIKSTFGGLTNEFLVKTNSEIKAVSIVKIHHMENTDFDVVINDGFQSHEEWVNELFDFESIKLDSGYGVKKVRAAKGMSQKEMAKFLGVTERTIQRWENHEVDMPHHAWIAISVLFNENEIVLN